MAIDRNGLLASLRGDSDDFSDNWKIIGLFTFLALLIFGYGCMLAHGLQFVGRIKFYMEPVAYTGFGSDLAGADATTPPSFNVTLHAKSTYGRTFCWDDDRSGSATVEVAYSGVVIAKADVAPFCVRGKEDKVIVATVTSGWPALPSDLRERTESDRRHGGVEVEVDLSFGGMWVRCRTTLDAKHASPIPCQYFSFIAPMSSAASL
ncbi:hypothetical protein ZWY2020_029622 [Hordeum vulgare]|nr:hypothetical protein ZWY2020_029622 [Hordeum vulgare]